MKILVKVSSTNDYNLVQCLYIELTPVLVELLRARVELIRPAVEDEQFIHMAFAESSPYLIFKLQDEMRPIAAQMDRDSDTTYVRMADSTTFSTSTEQERTGSGVIQLSPTGFSWRCTPRTANYEVLSGELPWALLEQL